MSRDDRDGPDSRHDNSSSASSLVILLILAGLLIALVVGGAVFALFRVRQNAQMEAHLARAEAEMAMREAASRELAAQETETMSLSSLLTRLEKNGQKYASSPTEFESVHGPAVLVAKDAKTLEAAAEKAKGQLEFHGPGVAYIQKCESAKLARERSEVQSNPSFSWGRFVFVSQDKTMLDQLRRGADAQSSR